MTNGVTSVALSRYNFAGGGVFEIVQQQNTEKN